MVDTQPPAAPTLTVTGSVVVNGTGESGTTVELFQDGVSQGTIAVTGGTWTRTLTGVTGTHAYTARATDFAGNVGPLSPAVRG
jgi:hypothetical protein